MRYIGETKCNAKVRSNEQINPTKSSELPKHLRSNIDHCFIWTTVANAPKNVKTRTNFKASYTVLQKLDLNEQKDLEILVLEMVSQRAINGIIQTPFKPFKFVVLSLIALDN